MKRYLVIFVLLAASVNATEWYVSPDGDDDNPGTLEQPFRTFYPAVTQAQPGDTIYVRGGVYTREHAMLERVLRSSGASSQDDCEEGWYYLSGTCYYDRLAHIVIASQDDWRTRGRAFTVSAGTPSQPITITAYPGETPYFDARETQGIYIDSQHWIIEGITMRGSRIYFPRSGPPVPEHITIRNNRLYDYGDGSNQGNVGMIKIDRGGATNIFIHNNTIHDIYDEPDGSWDATINAQHFAAVTTLSSEAYEGIEAASTGYIEIINNTIFNVPQMVYFKNPAIGPIKIEGNTIYNAQSIGIWASSNIEFTRNLVYNVPRIINRGGGSGRSDPRIDERSSWNFTITDNTFVDITGLTARGIQGGHHIHGNVITGFRDEYSHTGWGAERVLYMREETAAGFDDPNQSLLITWEVDNNCIVTQAHEPGYVRQQLERNGFERNDYTHAQAQEIFGFGVHDVLITGQDPLSPFVNPQAHDYRIQQGHPCEGFGANRAPRVRGDLTGDGLVTLQDLLLLVDQLGRQAPPGDPADLNEDGIIDLFDLVIVARMIGN